MNSKTIKKFTQVDLLYLLVVTLAVASGGIAFCSVFREQEFFVAFLDSDAVVLYGNLGFVLAPMAALLLGWRICLACCYRAFLPVNDRELPVVTIVIPAYNEGSQVLSTIRTVMGSEYPPDKMRVICVDDGSQDDTWMWMRMAQKEFPARIRLIRQPANTGKRHALLAGFQQAEGSVLVTLDSDSEVLTDTLRHLVSPFAASPGVGAVAGNVRVLNRKEGLMPKMLDLSFTMSFDFQRRGQSVYGGVLCTPGALSAYRASVILPALQTWADQTFLGRVANIGEDRALSNIVLRRGYRVAYQKDAVVMTNVPVDYRGLCRMMLRWARSNVRESLVMAQFLFGPFRRRCSGSNWLRLAGTMELLFLPLTEVLKVGLLAALLLHPFGTLRILALGCLFSALIPTILYYPRRPGLMGPILALGHAAFSVFCLSWISCWGLLSAGCSSWLTRELNDASCQPPLTTAPHSEAA